MASSNGKVAEMKIVLTSFRNGEFQDLSYVFNNEYIQYLHYEDDQSEVAWMVQPQRQSDQTTTKIQAFYN